MTLDATPDAGCSSRTIRSSVGLTQDIAESLSLTIHSESSDFDFTECRTRTTIEFGLFDLSRAGA